MALSDELRYERSLYYSLKENVGSVVGDLNAAYSNMDESSQINEALAIDGASADAGQIALSKNEIIQTRNKLSNEVISAIDNKISDLTVRIRWAEQQEAAEEAERLAALADEKD